MLPLVATGAAGGSALELHLDLARVLRPHLPVVERSQYPLSLGLFAFRAQHTTEWSLLLAASTLTTLPLIVPFLHAALLPGGHDSDRYQGLIVHEEIAATVPYPLLKWE